jgi:hypothetical protein
MRMLTRFSMYRFPTTLWTITPTADGVTLYTMPVRLTEKDGVSENYINSRNKFLDEPMIVFVGHTLLLGSVCLDIDDISNMIVNQER